MSHGTLSIVLHAHLPYVRHPEYPEFLEEDWFFEALTETYVPLVDVLDGLLNDGVDYRLTDHIAIKPFQVEYLMTQLNSTDGFGSHQNGVRYSAGVVFRLGSK